MKTSAAIAAIAVAVLAADAVAAGETSQAKRTEPESAGGRQMKQAEKTTGIRKLDDSVVDSTALNLTGGPWGNAINGQFFQFEAISSFGGFQYATYYDAQRQVCIARRKLPNGPWESIHFSDYRVQATDNHWPACLGICSGDGTIHLVFDDGLRYRISCTNLATRPSDFKWEASLFSGAVSCLSPGRPVKDQISEKNALGRVPFSELAPGKPITYAIYPYFVPTPGGDLLFFHMVDSPGNGDEVCYRYDPRSGTWNAAGMFISRRDGTNPYMNGIQYDSRGRLHATWVWCNTPRLGGYDLQYAYSDDDGRTWLNNRGIKIADLAAAMPVHKTLADVTVAPIPEKNGTFNGNPHTVDSHNRPHVLVYQGPENPGKAGDETYWTFINYRFHHYWRDESGLWTKSDPLPFAGARGGPLLLDREDNAYFIFVPYSEGDNASNSPHSTRRRGLVPPGELTIARATAKGKWNDWTVIFTEKGAFHGSPKVDLNLWQSRNVMSVYIQEWPEKDDGTPTPLRVITYAPSK